MQKDYLLRMIEQAFAGLAAIVRKAETGQFQLAEIEFDQSCRDTIGLGLDAVKRLSPDAVAGLLAQSGALRFTRSVILAEILLREAEVQVRADPAAAPVVNYVHAFCLLVDSIAVFSHEDEKIYGARLDELAIELEAYREMPQLKERFARYEVMKG